MSDQTLSDVFAGTRAEGRAALVGYLPAGFPSRADSAHGFRALIDGGCDIRSSDSDRATGGGGGRLVSGQRARALVGGP